MYVTSLKGLVYNYVCYVLYVNFTLYQYYTEGCVIFAIEYQLLYIKLHIQLAVSTHKVVGMMSDPRIIVTICVYVRT